jgi:hypothetical protein
MYSAQARVMCGATFFSKFLFPHRCPFAFITRAETGESNGWEDARDDGVEEEALEGVRAREYGVRERAGLGMEAVRRMESRSPEPRSP